MQNLDEVRAHVDRLRRFAGCSLHVPGMSIAIGDWISVMDAFLDGRQAESSEDHHRGIKTMRRIGYDSATLVVSIVCARYDVEFQDVVGPYRMRNVVMAKEAIVGVLRDLVQMSYPEIARQLGRHHHSFCQTAYQRWSRWPESERQEIVRHVIDAIARERQEVAQHGP